MPIIEDPQGIRRDSAPSGG